MKNTHGVVSAAALMGVLFWVVDAAVDSFFFYEASFVELLITDIPPHEVYMRVVVFIIMLVFGLVMSRIMETRDQAVEELRAREADQKVFIDSLPHKVFRKDADSVYIFVNQAFASDLDMTPNELTGNTDHDLFSKELADKYRADDVRLMASGQQEVIEEAYVVDGEETFVQTLKTAVADEDGNVIGVMGIFWDITERRQAEERIVHLNAVLRAIRNVNQLITQEPDPERMLQGVCQAMIETRGYFSACIVRLDEDGGFSEAFEAGLGESFAPVRELLARGETLHCVQTVLAGGGVAVIVDVGESCGECPLIATYEGNAAMAARLEHGGRVYGTLSVSIPRDMAQDQTEQALVQELADDIALAMHAIEAQADRRRAEEALRESEEELRNIVEFLPDATVVTDGDKRIVAWNRAMEQMTGVPKEDMLGQGDYAYAVPFYGERQPMVIDLTEGGDPSLEMSYDYVVRDSDGTIYAEGFAPLLRDGAGANVWMKASSLLDEDGNRRGAIETVRDVTEVRQAEEALRILNEELEERVAERTAELQAVNHELESFAYSVSHDLRAPLRSVDGFSAALVEDYGETLDGVAKDYLQRMRGGAQQMGRLIDDILMLSRVTRAEMSREAVDLTSLVNELDAEMREREPERDVAFTAEPDVTVQGDRALLRAVLTNLLDNAWKFTSKQPTATIEFGITEIDGETVCHVRDNGAGFDMTYVHKLFGPFQRLHRVDEFPGTGIGLATVQRIINRHGGRVWAEGEVGKGAAVYFTMARGQNGERADREG